MAEELKFKQIEVTAVVVPGPGGMSNVQERLYGLGEDGRVYILTDHGWSGMMMNKAGTKR